MRRYVLVVAVLAAIAVPVFLGLVALGSGLVLNMAYDKVAIRLADKMDLADGRQGRRILAFGGSNTFFDFRGVDVEAATGLPSINLGTHSGNGLKFLLWQAEATARPGDIVLLPLEDGYYTEPGITYYGANVSLAMGADFFRDLPLADKVTYLRNIHVGRLFKVVGARLDLGDYELEPDWTFPINANGDMEAPKPPAEQVSALIADVSGQRSSRVSLTPEAAATIQEFVARMKAKDIKFVFSLPGIMENAAPDAGQVEDLRAQLAALGADFLDLPERGSIPAEMMFDTIYHASTEGAEVYTAQLIQALCGSAERLDISCDEARVRAARDLLKARAERAYLFDASDTLAPLQPSGAGSPVILGPGQTERFLVASLRGCRSRLEIVAEGDGPLSVRVAGKAMDDLILSGEPTTGTYMLPDRAGLVPVEILASKVSRVRLTRIDRTSRCRR
ncbi:hypothetical protein [Microbaculum marinum]|uniref:Uncharacterized protein n=1 Tax=Microbaculum marinum TaxID=1764581 RepID=A0AAW9RL28_9HYPH